MTLRFMVVEDLGLRMRALAAICRATASPSGGPFAVVANDDWMMTAPEAAEMLDPETLASVDGVFVDFDLQAYKTPGYSSWEPFVLASGARFVPRTGMSVLLLLRELMETPEYRSARQARVDSYAPEEREWLGASGHTRLFSFVEAKDPVSRLFAASTALWFGTTYFNAQPDLRSPDELRRAVDQLCAGLDEPEKQDRLARKFRGAIPRVFDELMRTEFRGKSQNLVPDPHPWPTNYDLYATYLAHRGKRGFGPWDDPAGFREAVYAVTGTQLEPHRANKDSAAPLFGRMQAALEAFHTETDPNASDWPEWSGLDERRDPMFDYLQSSRLFWTSADVRVAHREHLRRTAPPQ